MYAAVPRITPTPVIIAGDGDRRGLRVGVGAGGHAAGSSAFARPKSSTFTVPSARTLMFAGFRSRWMMPCSCAPQRLGDLPRDRQRLVERDRALRDPIGERRPSTSSTVPSSRKSRDVRVVQRAAPALRAGSARLVPEDRAQSATAECLRRSAFAGHSRDSFRPAAPCQLSNRRAVTTRKCRFLLCAPAFQLPLSVQSGVK